MLEDIDLDRKMEKAEYKTRKDSLERELTAIQQSVRNAGLPVIVVFEGWDAAGKGTILNDLIVPMDPRGFSVHSILPPNEEERLHPFLWRFWARTPAKGRFTFFDRSWYRAVLNDRVEANLKGRDLEQAFQDIESFERQLSDSGVVILKFFLHISRGEQKRRFKKLRKSSATSWRVTKDDLKRHRLYDDYRLAADEMLARTDSENARWTVVEAQDHRFASIKVFETMVAVLKNAVQSRQDGARAPKKQDNSSPMGVSILDKIDLSLELSRDQYRTRLKKLQKKIRELEHRIYMQRIPVVVVYEGCDAAGKGGNIKRLTEHLDPRGYEVVPISAPNDLEKSHHYLWRFWTQMPKAGHITIFDRSWYGRVLVERVEGFCSPDEWKRAYREINEMEAHLVAYGTVVVKFWLHIDQDEQLKRFKDREANEYKKWKITDEDWRNREKWDQYKLAIEEMLYRTGTPCAPWTVVESNCKLYARVRALECMVNALKARLAC